MLSESNLLCTPSPWSKPIDPEVFFPLEPYEKLLADLGWNDPFDWLDHWLNRGGIGIASSSWPFRPKSDWLWGLGLPFLSDLERYFVNSESRVLYGISGLPGCGKTSFGKWLEVAADELGCPPLTVISMDDFYLPSSQMDQAMAGNPWNAPRALPGSHSINLLEKTIDNWLQTGHLLAPKFDKALRNGLGDRCGWSRSQPKVLVIEGWFLGCPTAKKKHFKINKGKGLSQQLTEVENEYQIVIQESLKKYQSIWSQFKHIWHLKAVNFTCTSNWKRQQEMAMFQERGASLRDESLDSFIRMVQASIPQGSLESIEADVVIRIDSLRKIEWVGRKRDQPD